MHRLPNQRSVLRFRFAATLLILKWLLVIVSAGALGVALFREDRELAGIAIGLFFTGIVLWLGHWGISRRTKCPLCLVPSFSHLMCSRNAKARHFMGSYPLFVAITVVSKGSFRCPYCGEPTAMEVRRRSPQLRRSRG